MRSMKFFTLLTISVFLTTASAVHAQKPSPTANPNQGIRAHSESPLGCESNCLWYSGDFDASNSNANGLFNGYSSNAGYGAQTWVPFLPSYNSSPWYNSVQITSITFNELLDAPTVTGMTYTIAVSVAPGFSGHTLYSGNCNYSQPTATGRSAFGLTEYALTCNLPSPIKLPTGSVYMVNVYPTVPDSPYLSNAMDFPEVNQVGWSDVMDGSYFNSSYFGNYFVNANDLGDGWMSEFSVGMTGYYVHAYPVH